MPVDRWTISGQWQIENIIWKMENAPPSRFRYLLTVLVPLRKLDVACNVMVNGSKTDFINSV
jgi:hypothetical protein